MDKEILNNKRNIILNIINESNIKIAGVKHHNKDNLYLHPSSRYYTENIKVKDEIINQISHHIKR